MLFRSLSKVDASGSIYSTSYAFDSANVIQNSSGKRFQIGSYWGIELIGMRQVNNWPTNATGTVTDANVSIINTSNGIVGLLVKGGIAQTADLQQWQDSSGTVLTKISPSGNIIFGSQYLSVSDASAYGRLQLQNGGTNQTLLYPYSGGFVISNQGVTGMTIVKVKGTSGQTGDLQQWQNSSGTILGSISSSGNQLVGSATQAGKIYNTNSSGVESVTSPLTVRGTAAGQNLIELWAYGKDALISNAVGNGTSVVYTTTITHGYAVNDWVVVGGISHTGGSGSLKIGRAHV